MFEPFDIPEVKEYLTSLKGVQVELEYNAITAYYTFRMSSVHCSLTRQAHYDPRYHVNHEETRAVLYLLKQLAEELGNDIIRLPRINYYTDNNRNYEYTRKPDIETLKQKFLGKQDPIKNDNAGIF